MGLKEGPNALVDRGISRVIIETDSSQAANLLQGYPENTHPLLGFILECKRLHSKVWSSFVNCVPRNYNVCAHILAKLGHSVCLQLRGTVWYNEIPTSVSGDLINEMYM